MTRHIEKTHRRLIRWRNTCSIAEVCDLPSLTRAAEMLGLALETPGETSNHPADISVTPSGSGYLLTIRNSRFPAADTIQLTHFLAIMIPWSFFQLCEHPVLHASSCVVDGEAVLFCGDSEAGKSSLAAAAWEMGLTVINDDCTAIDPLGTRVRPFPQGLSLRLEEPVVPKRFESFLVEGGPYFLGEGWKCDHWLLLGRSLKGMAPLEAEFPVRALYLIRRGALTRRFSADRKTALRTVLAQTFPAKAGRLAILPFLESLWRRNRVYELEVGDGDISGAFSLSVSL